MHDSAFLHIRSRDGRATRIVSLTEPSVRIGRGPSCEVRLDDPALAEVECLLRRRGDAWHLQPVSPSGRLTLDGRPADRPRALPFGATLRMADRWLTLLPTMDAPEAEAEPGPAPGPTVLDVSDPEPSLIPGPEPVDPGASEGPEGSDPGPEHTGADVDASSDPLESRKAELTRLEARLRQRERWLKDRLHERQWEARWRAAGASLKGRERTSEAPEPRPRSTAPPPRPTVGTGPSLKERRGVVPPASPRFDRPASGDPPSYRVPTDRVPTAPEPSPTPVEPPPGRGLRVGPSDLRIDRDPPQAVPVDGPGPIGPSPSNRGEVPVVPAAPDPIATGPEESPVGLADPLELETGPDERAAQTSPENGPSAKESDDPAIPAPADDATLPPPIGRIGAGFDPPEAEADADAPAEMDEEEDLLGSLAEEFADAIGRGRAASESVEPDPGTIEEAPTDPEPASVWQGPAGVELTPDPVGFVVEEGSVAPSSPETETETTEAATVESVDPAPSPIVVREVKVLGVDRPGPSEEVGASLTIRGPSGVDPAEDAPDASPDPMPVPAGDDPSSAAITSVEVDAEARAEAEPAPRRWGMLPTLDLSDLVSFLRKPDQPDAPAPGAVDGPAVGGRSVEEAPVGEAPVEARVVEPVQARPTAPIPVEEGEWVEAAEGFEAETETAGVESEDHDGLAGVGESASVRASGEWPSAKAMLGEEADWGRRRRPSRNRITGDMPIPTDRIAPDEWTVPGGAWLCIPLMFVCLAVGVMGVRLSWTWAGIDREAGLLSDRLALGIRPEPGRIERLLEKEEELPGASWWNSTGDQMIIRAALRSGPGNLYDPASQERAGALLHAAASASPGHPSLRFAHAWRALQEPGNDSPAVALGLSRDIWPLAWSGRALLAEGKLDEAKRAYRSALEMACRSRPDPTLTPTFHEEARGGRFGLPLEEVLSVVVDDMANRPEWSIEDWEGVLPDFAGAWLVAGRVLRRRGDSSAADRLLDRAVTLGDAPAPVGCSEAIHEASSAEALALLGRFEESAERYRSAVDRLSGGDLDITKRAWMFNLAELHGRLGGSREERSCLLASMITDPDEPITFQAIRIQVRKGLSLVTDEDDAERIDDFNRDEQDEAGLTTAASARTPRSLGD